MILHMRNINWTDDVRRLGFSLSRNHLDLHLKSKQGRKKY
jgi:hypothetical protein